MIDPYIQQIHKVPLLAWNEEADVIRAAQNGNKQARERAICANLRLVVYTAKKFMQFCTPGLTFQDLIEEGNLGLIRALDLFDPSFGCRFGTYATFWIKQTIRKAIINQRHLIRVPNCTQSKSYAYNLENAPTEAIRDAVRTRLTLTIDLLPKRDQPLLTTDTSKEDEEERRANIKKCRKAIKCLNQRERSIIVARFWENRTLKEIGDKLGITKERVRQIQAGALNKIQNYLCDGIITTKATRPLARRA